MFHSRPLAASGLAAAWGLAAAPAQAQQTLTLTLSAVPQNSAVPTTYGDVTFQTTAADATVTLTAGVPQTVDLGTLDASYDTSAFPLGVNVPFTFGFGRTLTATGSGAGGPFTFSEPLAGSGFALHDGSAGQYETYGFSVDGATADVSLGPSGTLQTAFQPGMMINYGLGDVPAPLSTVLTLVAAPEPPASVGLAPGVPGLAGLALRARKRCAR